ncbi:MAG TPA: type II toxin-antitoxin system RelE/ParE family toxin [Lacunisphaera sp.]|nr:type II toxin-antitoxin system RelE/ParE family toxin [Lacunisphaera sp.]
MRLLFRNPRLAVIRTEQAQTLGFAADVVAACQKKLHFLESVPDELTLRGWKSLHYEKLVGDREGQRSIRLNKYWRLIFVLDEATTPPTIEILELEDYH